MLSCRDLTRRASLIVDGELPAAERFGVRVHLLICTHCRRFLKQLRGLKTAISLRSAEQDAVPVDAAFAARLVKAMEAAAPAAPPDTPPAPPTGAPLP